ncbi:hypothetical protein TrVE_jg1781 [Triparma verrucosa]|uniref:Uncharacterized protein n=1 Tax=Triparma verrucosa TaxID=1606542 RepID=A0A9W7FGS7_9STRA|nr:hypothetical protein TrVE_jg1781 [Triparma verrucosa]
MSAITSPPPPPPSEPPPPATGPKSDSAPPPPPIPPHTPSLTQPPRNVPEGNLFTRESSWKEKSLRKLSSIDVYSKTEAPPVRVHPFFIYVCLLEIISAVCINAYSLFEQIYGDTYMEMMPFAKNYIHLLDDLIMPFSILAWIFIVVADPRGSNSYIYVASFLNILCSAFQIIGDVLGSGELASIEKRYEEECINNDNRDWQRAYDNCTVGVDTITTEYATAYLQSQRGIANHVVAITVCFVCLKRAVFPGRKILASFDTERLESIILNDNIIFLASVLSAMMFVLSQAISCLSDHQIKPEMCYDVVLSCSCALWFGCAAFAANTLVLPFKTSSYAIEDLMRFDMSFHEQCQVLFALWSIMLVLFVFASGVALDEDMASFWMFIHTIEPWGLPVRSALFMLTMLLMAVGLSLTKLEIEQVRRYSERQARRSRRLLRIADEIRVKLRSSQLGEWAPAFRYTLLFASVVFQFSVILYYHYRMNDYEEALKWHDASVFFVSSGYMLGALFSATKPKSTSWWQANFQNLPIMNFFSLGIFSLATGNYHWGIMEIITAVVGLSLRPYYLNARKLLANLADVNMDSHLSDSLQTSFIIIPSVTFLIAEVFSCYTTELKRGSCYQLFFSNWTVAMWLGLSFLVKLIFSGTVFKSHCFESWCFFQETTFENLSRCVSSFITAALSFFIFGLRSYNVLDDEPPFDPLTISEKSYKTADRKLMTCSGILCTLVLGTIVVDAIVVGLKASHLQRMTEVHEEEDLEGHSPRLFKVIRLKKRIEAKLELERYSVPDDAARVSSLYTDIIFYSCVFGSIVQIIGMLLGNFAAGDARNIGIFIQVTYWLGVIPHGLLVTSYMFSDLEPTSINVGKKLIMKWSFLSISILKVATYIYSMEWFLAAYDSVWFIILYLGFAAMSKNRQSCASDFSLSERRQHLVLCFKILIANCPTQLYFVGELVSCLARQLNLTTKGDETHSFELLENSCIDIFYGICPIALFNGFCIINYINYGFLTEFQHNIKKVSTLNLTPFALYRTAHSVVLIGIAVFAYSLRHEDGYNEDRSEWSVLYILVGVFCMLVVIEIALTAGYRIIGYIAKTFQHNRSVSRRSLSQSDRTTLSMEERMEDREKSMWEGGSKGMKRPTMSPIHRKGGKGGIGENEMVEKVKKKNDEEKGRVFEISPGFL